MLLIFFHQFYVVLGRALILVFSPKGFSIFLFDGGRQTRSVVKVFLTRELEFLWIIAAVCSFGTVGALPLASS